MLKICLKDNNNKINYTQINLPFEELKFSSDGKLVSGYFDSSYKIKDGDTVSILTDNSVDYKDVVISTQDIKREGYFYKDEVFDIEYIEGYINITESDNFIPIKLNIDNDLSNTVDYNKQTFVKVYKRYVKMPNGKIYYEIYDIPNELQLSYDVENNSSNGISTAYIDYYKVEDLNGNIIWDFNNLPSSCTKSFSELNYTYSSDNEHVICPIFYYVNNDILTYNDVDYIFSENYQITNDNKIFIEVKDKDNNTVILSDYTKYKEQVLLTYFEITAPNDILLDIDSIATAEEFFYIDHKNKKYDLEFVNGKWQVNIEGDIYVFESNNVLNSNISEAINLYPTDFEINGESYPILNEYRTVDNGSYLLIHTNGYYDISSNSKIIWKQISNADEKFEVYQDINGDYYIKYNNFRKYLNKNMYKFTISRYVPSYDENGNFNKEEDLDILYEFEVTLTESEFRKYQNGEECIATYKISDEDESTWQIVPSTSTIDKVYKRGYIIDYDNENTAYKDILSECYKFNVYRYVTIDNVDYKVNLPNKILNDINDYYVTCPSCSYDFTIYDASENLFICRPKIDDELCEIEHNFNINQNVNKIDDLFKEPYRRFIKQIKIYNSSFSIKNESFGVNYGVTINKKEYKELTDIGFFKLYKKVNFFSIPLKFSTNSISNLYQDEIIEKSFFEDEKEKAINPIVDMEKDIYYPVIKDENGIYNKVTNIKFNFHFRTRDNEWKIDEEKTWNIFDKYLDKDNKELYGNNLPQKVIESSDLLTFLNFTENDVFYQKNRLGKSFIRLLFYDSPNTNNQNLLHSSTIFLNENDLYNKYIKNSSAINYVPYEKINSDYFTFCNVNSEPIDNEGNIDYSQDRLEASFKVLNRSETKESSEGFYIYMFKEYGTKIRPSDIYLKIEFNHAGEGKILQFFMPTLGSDSNKITSIVLDEDSTEITNLNISGITSLKEGISLKDFQKSQYIKLKTEFNKELNKYVYYIPSSYMKSLEWENNTMIFNLWEIKIKNEL